MSESTKITFKEVFSSFRNWPRVFKLLWDVNKKNLILIMVINIVLGIIPSLLLLSNQYLINSISVGWEKGLEVVIKGLIFLTSVYLSQLFFSQISEYFKGIFVLELSNHVKVMLMEKSTKLSLSDFENDVIYDQLQRAQMEADSRPYQVFEQILLIISSFITLFSTAMILIAWKWWIIILLLIIPIFSAVSFLKLGKKEFDVEWERAPRRRKLWYLSFLITRDTNIKEIKLYNLSSYLLGQYKNIYSNFIKVDRGLLKKRTVISLGFNFLNQIIVTGLTLFILMAAFTKQILIGTMVTYIQALTTTQSSSQSLLHQIFSMYENNLYIEQLFSFLDVPEGEQKYQEKGNNGLNALENIHSIEFRNVSFKYPGKDKYALKNLNFTIKKGEVIAIVGKNGSGKSTLVKLITRLYDDFEGEILINSKPLVKYSTQILREKIGVVFQDFVKYELSVRENVGFGNLSNLNDDMLINNSIQSSGIEGLINSFPEKLDTQLGKWFADGNQLSGGEWQKIAIARSIMKDAEVYVLDEPSSSLDANAEKELFEKFNNLIRYKLGIFISHRFSTVKHATQILVMDDGHIIERGTHAQLLNEKGLYSELYNLQALPYINEPSVQTV